MFSNEKFMIYVKTTNKNWVNLKVVGYFFGSSVIFPCKDQMYPSCTFLWTELNISEWWFSWWPCAASWSWHPPTNLLQSCSSCRHRRGPSTRVSRQFDNLKEKTYISYMVLPELPPGASLLGWSRSPKNYAVSAPAPAPL